jgi:hypothetical protein
VTERDELSILEQPGSDTEPAQVWLGAAVAAVVLIALTMAALALLVLVFWGLSVLVTWFGVPRLPGPFF